MSLYSKKQEQEIVALQTQILELRNRSDRLWDQIDSHRREVAILIGKKERITLYGRYYLVFILWLMWVLAVYSFEELFSRNLATLSFFLSIFVVLVIPLILIKLVKPSYENEIMKCRKLINPLLDQTRNIYRNLFEIENRIQQLELHAREYTSASDSTPFQVN